MPDIPSFEPNWKLENTNIQGPNADTFETLWKTLERIELIKEEGRLNLYKKGVLIKEDYPTVMDIIDAIKNVPLSNGLPRMIPQFQSSCIPNRKLQGTSDAWITSLPFIIKTFANARNAAEQGLSNQSIAPYYVNFQRTQPKTSGSTSIKSIIGDSLFAFIYYSRPTKEERQVVSMDQNWQKIHTTAAKIVGEVSYYVDIYMKKIKATGEIEEASITNDSDAIADFYLLDVWNYSKNLFNLNLESFGSGTISVNKLTDNPVLWILWGKENDNYYYYIKPDNMSIHRIFDDILQVREHMIIYDAAPKGNRNFSYDGSSTYALTAFELKGDDI